MRPLLSSAGWLLDVVGSATWALAAFFLTARLVSPAAGAVLGLGIFVSALTMMLMSRFQETRALALQRGVCPRCDARLSQTHSHRRWDTSRERWLAPLTAWECTACGYGHEEPAPCATCPEAA